MPLQIENESREPTATQRVFNIGFAEARQHGLSPGDAQQIAEELVGIAWKLAQLLAIHGLQGQSRDNAIDAIIAYFYDSLQPKLRSELKH